MTTTSHPTTGLRFFAPHGAKGRRGRKGKKLAVQYVIRTERDLDDAVDAFTALRVALIAEIDLAEATHYDRATGRVLTYRTVRSVDEIRLSEARAQLERIDATLGMMTGRRP